MAGNIGDAISQTIPTVGASGTQYATDIDAFLTEIKGRLNVKVPRASLAAGALDLASNALQNASYVSIASAGGTPTTPASSIQQNGGDLYWVTASGQVKITSGNALNTASIGGITGDYGGGNPAQFRFVDADQEYYAYDDYAGAAWARVWAKNFDIAAGATAANRARLAFGGGGSYTITLPTALPAATAIVQLSATGQLTTGGVVNSPRSRAFTLGGIQSSTASITNGSGLVTFAAGGTSYIPVHGINDNEQLETIKIFYNATGVNNLTWTLGKTSTTAITAPWAAIAGATATPTTSSGVSVSVTLTPTTPALLTSGDTYWLKLVMPAGLSCDAYAHVTTISIP